MPKVNLKVPNQAQPVQLDYKLEGERFTVTLDNTLHEGQFTLTDAGAGWLTLHGQPVPFYLTRKQDSLSIWLRGKTYHLDLLDAGGRRGGSGGASALSDSAIKAPMPGTVLKVLVQPDDAVVANQPLMIMESMKMEMTLSAPGPGTVEAVHCQENQLVDMGALLLKLNLKTD